MSHPSKVAEIASANKKGYRTYLYFICTDNADINVNRVARRVEKGGHRVGDEKVKSRYLNTLNNLYPAIKLVNRAYLFDNSGKKLSLLAEISEGSMQLKVNQFPNWFSKYILIHFK